MQNGGNKKKELTFFLEWVLRGTRWLRGTASNCSVYTVQPANSLRSSCCSPPQRGPCRGCSSKVWITLYWNRKESFLQILLKQNTALLSIFRPSVFCMGLGKLCPGGGSCSWDSQLHLHQEDSVMVGEDLVYSLILTPFINSVSCLLCQPPFWGCQSRPKLVPQEAEAAKADGNWCHKRVLLAGAHLIYSHIRFCIFLIQLWVVCFCTCEDDGLYKRLAISCTGW